MEKRYTQRLKAPTTWFLCAATMYLWVGFWLLAMAGAIIQADLKMLTVTLMVLTSSITFLWNHESFWNKDIDYTPNRGAFSWFTMGILLVIPTRFLLPFWAGSVAMHGHGAQWLVLMSLVVLGEFVIRTLDARHERKLARA